MKGFAKWETQKGLCLYLGEAGAWHQGRRLFAWISRFSSVFAERREDSTAAGDRVLADGQSSVVSHTWAHLVSCPQPGTTARAS